MIVPRYWAEARIRQERPPRQITVRRFGWSDVSEEEAQAHADARAREAIERITSGELLLRREPRVPYDGADGVPIREEIVSRYGDTVITRNSYGARCLNTPDVAFADVDFDDREAGGYCAVVTALLGVAVWGSWWLDNWRWAVLFAAVAVPLSAYLCIAFKWMTVRLSGGAEAIARRKVDAFIAARPDWLIRLYRTPAGFRMLFMHRTFDPRSDETGECLAGAETDPFFIRMCRVQNCFRARVSPKPWRLPDTQALWPRGLWPWPAELLPMRADWVRDYEARAEAYASCRFIGGYGSGPVHSSARAVQLLHDELCRADSELPLA